MRDQLLKTAISLIFGRKLEKLQLRQQTCYNKLWVSSQIAAETNSAECARILLEAGASAGTRDDSGMTALTVMVTKMPSVVSEKHFKSFKRADGNLMWPTRLCTHIETK